MAAHADGLGFSRNEVTDGSLIYHKSETQYHQLVAEPEPNDSIQEAQHESQARYKAQEHVLIHDCKSLLNGDAHISDKTKFTDGRLLRTHDKVISDHWTFELIGIVVSVVTLASICGLLLAYSDRPTPRLTFNISLNTAVSILATLSRASVIFVASSVIAQQKWLRFRQHSRSLYDILLHDNATRGPLGSLYLLGSLRLGLTSAVAATVIVFALGLEPFVQQSVKYPLRDIYLSSSTPHISVAERLMFDNSTCTNWTVLADVAILQALYSENVMPIAPVCTDNSCEWPHYQSIAFCQSCESAMDKIAVTPQRDTALEMYRANKYTEMYNISHMNLNILDYSSVNLTYSATTQYNISLGAGSPALFNLSVSAVGYGSESFWNTVSYPKTLVWDLNEKAKLYRLLGTSAAEWMRWSNITINGVKGPLRAFGFLELKRAADDSRLNITSAQTCVISICAQQYSSTFRNGSFSRRTVREDFGLFWRDGVMAVADGNGPSAGNYETLHWNTTFNGSGFNVPWSIFDGFNILPDTYATLARLQGVVRRVDQMTGLSGESTTYNADSGMMTLLADVQNATARLAQGLTNFIQQNGDKQILGRAYAASPFVEVRWLWLAFPLALVPDSKTQHSSVEDFTIPTGLQLPRSRYLHCTTRVRRGDWYFPSYYNERS